ncbi:hypothetical protein OC845_003427 [Tilletia horrida]|nr:hypothetical protein OC845_003427 [Tilletia horrida]
MCAVAAASGTKPLLQNSRVQVSSITAFYPATDGRPTAKRTMPKGKPRSGVNISPWIGRIFTTAYIVNLESVYDKRVSLILHKAEELPPHLLIIAGNADSLHDDSVNFIDNLNTQCPPHPDAKMLSIPEESHAWDKRPMCEESLQSRDYAYKAALESIKAGLGIL